MEYVLCFVIIVVGLAIWFFIAFRQVTVFEYERGLKYVRGRFKGLLEPGQYWHVPLFVRIETVDTRPRFVSILGQEVLSADGVTLKVSLAAEYQITDPITATNKAYSYREALYIELQLALREIIGTADIDTILANRGELSKQLVAASETKIQELGLRLISVNLKDIMFPGKLKEIFAQVVNARKEGLAALERARGETAALRNLANAAKMLESNPNLMQLRLIQALGTSSGHTLILGMPSHSVPVPVRGKDASRAGELPR